MGQESSAMSATDEKGDTSKTAVCINSVFILKQTQALYLMSFTIYYNIEIKWFIF